MKGKMSRNEGSWDLDDECDAGKMHEAWRKRNIIQE